MKINNIIRNFTLALCLTSVLNTAQVLASDKDPTTGGAHVNPIQKKSYGTFIQGIAQETTNTLKKYKDNNELKINLNDRMNLLAAYKKMIYATLYGKEVEVVNSQVTKIIGSFDRDNSGKKTKVNDTRIQHILEVCNNIAFNYNLINQYKGVDTGMLFPILVAPLDKLPGVEEDEFSYLQRLMLVRIILGYSNKMSPMHNFIASNEAIFKNRYLKETEEEILVAGKTPGSIAAKEIKTAPPQIPTPEGAAKTMDQYWPQTNAATQLIYDNAIYKGMSKTLGEFIANTVEKYPALQAYRNITGIHRNHLALGIANSNIKDLSAEAEFHYNKLSEPKTYHISPIQNEYPEYKAPLDISNISYEDAEDQFKFQNKYNNTFSTIFNKNTLNELGTLKNSDVVILAHYSLKAYQELEQRYQQKPSVQLYMRLNKHSLTELKAKAQIYEAQLKTITSNWADIKDVLTHAIQMDQDDAKLIISQLEGNALPTSIGNIPFYICRILHQDFNQLTGDKKVNAARMLKAVQVLKTLRNIPEFKKDVDFDLVYFLASPKANSPFHPDFFDREIQKLETAKGSGQPFNGPLNEAIIEVIDTNWKKGNPLEKVENKEKLIGDILDSIEAYYQKESTQ